MRYFVNILLDKNDTATGMILTVEMSFKSLFHALMSLYRKFEPDPGSIERFEKLLHKIEKIEGYRNKLIHSEWNFNEAENRIERTKYTAKFANGLKSDQEVVEIDSMQQWRFRLYEAISELTLFVMRWQENHPSDKMLEALQEHYNTEAEKPAKTVPNPRDHS
jgi:hypothetical protein